jgi:hypothetical protein
MLDNAVTGEVPQASNAARQEQPIASVVLSRTANLLLVLAVRKSSDFVPVFLSHIVVNLYGARIETVTASLLAA